LPADRANAAGGVRAATPSKPSTAPQVVRLMRNGKVVDTLRLDTGTLRWEHETPDASAASEITLDEAQAQRLRRALDKLGP
jgi:hypothetical protein